MAKAKKKAMGDLGALVGQGKRPVSGAQALAAITGGKAAPAVKDEITTTVTLRRDQWDALRMAAARRAAEKAGGRDAPRKANASEVLREALDEWLRKNG